MIPEHERPWRPLSVAAVHGLFHDAPFPWWVAGGHAIELAAGRPIRPHDDIDILLLRRDQVAARALLGLWDCWVADPPGTLRAWPVGETLPTTSHDIWCRETPQGPWLLQIMLDESEGDRWVSRRDARISRRIMEIGAQSGDGVPYLRPEIQLLYKARGLRPKDDIDFDAALPTLDDRRREWLRDAIGSLHGHDHPWRRRLGEPAW